MIVIINNNNRIFLSRCYIRYTSYIMVFDQKVPVFDGLCKELWLRRMAVSGLQRPRCDLTGTYGLNNMDFVLIIHLQFVYKPHSL